MYCWVIATPFPDYKNKILDPARLLIHTGTDEEEAVRVAKESAPSYRKVVAKAIGGVLLYRQVNPEIRYASYLTVGLNADHYGGVFPKKKFDNGHDRDEAIAVARQHAGEFERVEVWVMGECEEGFDSRGAVLSISRPQSHL